MYTDPFKEYIRETEPDKRTKVYTWRTAVGLQQVDGLVPSEKLVETAVENIEGYISFEAAAEKIDSYYKSKPRTNDTDRTEEADKVSVRIAQILSEQSFSLSPSEYIGIHKRLFRGIYKHAGKIRDYNITKKEWVLGGNTVLYANALDLRETLEYDFSQERKFSYKGLSVDEIIHHLSFFISRLWQIHIFGEGNTRTTAVFFIKYLRSLGYNAQNDIFADNAWYFRNALVRANYTDLSRDIHETTMYLERFIRNLLLGENNELKNRYLHIDAAKLFEKSVIEKQAIEYEKSAIQSKKSAIEHEKSAIEKRLSAFKINSRIIHNIELLYTSLGTNAVFGRGDVSKICSVSYSAAGDLIARMAKYHLIEKVSGHGKGKYVFADIKTFSDNT